MAHYLSMGDRHLVVRFVEGLERTVSQIARGPHNGSLRFAYELELPDLRCWPIPRLPYLISYIEVADRIVVWRVLHTRRDIAGLLDEPDDLP